MPTVSEYEVFQEASAEVQENMTFYYNSSASLRTWSANSEEGSRALSPVFGDIFGEGQSNCQVLFVQDVVMKYIKSVYVTNYITFKLLVETYQHKKEKQSKVENKKN